MSGYSTDGNAAKSSLNSDDFKKYGSKPHFLTFSLYLAFAEASKVEQYSDTWMLLVLDAIFVYISCHPTWRLMMTQCIFVTWLQPKNDKWFWELVNYKMAKTKNVFKLFEKTRVFIAKYSNTVLISWSETDTKRLLTSAILFWCNYPFFFVSELHIVSHQLFLNQSNRV